MDKKSINASSAIKKYSVAHSKVLGRYMVAAKNFAAGEVIIRENALAVGPAMFETKIIFCFACMRSLSDYPITKTRYTCTKCEVAPLCNRLCEESIGYHSAKECQVFREKKELCLENIEEIVRILLHLRLWLLKDVDNETWNRLWSMEAHLEERRDTPVWHERETSIIDVFRKLGLHESSSSSSESLQRLCGVVDVNTFELRTPGGPEFTTTAAAAAPLLRGLFLEAALMAHACRGTAHVTVDDTFRMTVYAALPIQTGEPIYFNYTSSLLGTIERQEFLQEGKYFRCGCNACNDPLEGGSNLSSILCPRCRKDYVAMQKPNDREPYGRKSKWQCQRCKRLYRGCLVKSTIDISKTLISQQDNLDFKGLESLLEKLSRTFHTNHFVMISLKQKLLALYRKEMTGINPQRKVFHKMLELGKELLALLEIVEPGISRLKGILLYELHLPLAVLANREYASGEISAEQLVSQLEESQGQLKRSLTMLLLEPPNIPEGLLAKRALQEMKLLAQNVEDAKALASREKQLPKKDMYGQRREKNRKSIK